MTRDELITKKFPHALIGYDINSVDRFIDEIIRELDRLHAELDGLKRELSGSTAESVIEEANVIEAEDERKRLERRNDEAPDRTYGSFLPAEFFDELNEKTAEENEELSTGSESESGSHVEEKTEELDAIVDSPVEEDSEELDQEADSLMEENAEEPNSGVKNTITEGLEELNLDEIPFQNLEKDHVQLVPELEQEEHMNESSDENGKIKVNKPRQKGIYRPTK